MKINKLTILALTTTVSLGYVGAAGADQGKSWRDNSGSQSHRARTSNSPVVVETPPDGTPSHGAMDTGDQGGWGMARRDRFDQYGSDSSSSTADRGRMHRRSHDTSRIDEESSSTVSSSDTSNTGSKDSSGMGATGSSVSHEAGNEVSDTDHAASSSDDRMVYHSASADEHGSVGFGEDIPALRGLQLEVALNRLHHINQKEIELAKMAETRAKSQDVLNLAHRIRADHEKLENNVKSVASRRNIELKSYQPATYETALRDRLEKLKGTEFENAFLRVNERGHEEAARELRMVRNDLRDTEVRNLINSTLPQIASHAKMPSGAPRARASSEGGSIGE